jgi:hypothetical protein
MQGGLNHMTARISKINKNLLIAIVLTALGIVLNFAIFSPGFMSEDSIYQYLQAREQIFSDSHPPLMSILWSYFFIFPNPIPLFLLFQLSILWSAIGISFYLDSKNSVNRNQIYLVFLLPVLPQIASISGVLWKDVQMAYSLLLSVVLIRYSETKVSSSFKIFLNLSIIVLLVYAINIRVNAVFAVFPILYYLLSRNVINKHKFYLFFASGLILVSFYIFSSFAISKMYNVQKANTLNAYFIDDLFQYSMKKQVSLIPDVPLSLINTCNSQVIANSDKILKIFCILNNSQFEYSSIPTSNLLSTWSHEIYSDPIYYLNYRFNVFKNFLSSPLREPWYFWHPIRISANDLGLVFKDRPITFFFEKYIYIGAENFKYLFQPYFWLLVLMYLLFENFRKKHKIYTLEKSILHSCTFYFASYLPVVAAPDYRYIYWITLGLTYFVYQNKILRKPL